MSRVPCGRICHQEKMEVTLRSCTRGSFGLVVHDQIIKSNSSQSKRLPLFISFIEKNSPAERYFFLSCFMHNFLCKNSKTSKLFFKKKGKMEFLNIKFNFNMLKKVKWNVEIVHNETKKKELLPNSKQTVWPIKFCRKESRRIRSNPLEFLVRSDLSLWNWKTSTGSYDNFLIHQLHIFSFCHLGVECCKLVIVSLPSTIGLA